eukprot:763735-Hanusia_phi.AAC.3
MVTVKSEGRRLGNPVDPSAAVPSCHSAASSVLSCFEDSRLCSASAVQGPESQSHWTRPSLTVRYGQPDQPLSSRPQTEARSRTPGRDRLGPGR